MVSKVLEKLFAKAYTTILIKKKGKDG